eukprot:1591064-Alexandrium_andersonii.AAC.1
MDRTGGRDWQEKRRISRIVCGRLSVVGVVLHRLWDPGRDAWRERERERVQHERQSGQQPEDYH